MEQILSAAQRTRLAQIRLSVAGLRVLLRDDIASRIKISGVQRTRIEKVLKVSSATAHDAPRWKSDGKTVPGQSKSTAQDMSAQIAAMLTREQLAIVRDLLGPALDGSQVGRVKFTAPDLVGQDGWINSEPLTMSQLKGKVVAAHFF